MKHECYPDWVREIIKEEYRLIKGKDIDEEFFSKQSVSSMFTWDDSRQGIKIWDEVKKGDYELLRLRADRNLGKNGDTIDFCVKSDGTESFFDFMKEFNKKYDLKWYGNGVIYYGRLWGDASCSDYLRGKLCTPEEGIRLLGGVIDSDKKVKAAKDKRHENKKQTLSFNPKRLSFSLEFK